jgi:hypothetical protein
VGAFSVALFRLPELSRNIKVLGEKNEIFKIPLGLNVANYIPSSSRKDICRCQLGGRQT